jgi:uracil-DNA glycosylase
MLAELIPTYWQNSLADLTADTKFKELDQFVEKRFQSEKIVYPRSDRIFYALDLVKPEDVKVVLIGQDPYHGQDQAMGLSFSVPLGHKIPPSLRNIFKEYMQDLNLPYPSNGDLTKWAKQGVLLLNSVLTVDHKSAGSHTNQGWEWFTDNIIRKLSESQENLVFLLWGKFAQQKKSLVDKNKHLVLEAAHPSPLARNKFSDCKHFSKTNLYLSNKKKKAINWKLD